MENSSILYSFAVYYDAVAACEPVDNMCRWHAQIAFTRKHHYLGLACYMPPLARRGLGATLGVVLSRACGHVGYIVRRERRALDDTDLYLADRRSRRRAD